MIAVRNNLQYWRKRLGVTGKYMETRVPVSNGQWPMYEAGREPKITMALKILDTYNEIAKEKELDIKLAITDLWPN
jgi:predicted transcriptional regulator